MASEAPREGLPPEAARRPRRTSGVSGKVLAESIARLSPVSLVANPVMLVVEVTFFIVAAMAVYPQGFFPVASAGERGYYVEIAAILLITVWFSTLSDALAEQQAKNTASSLRKLETKVVSKKVVRTGWQQTLVETPSKELRKGDLVLVEKGDIVPLDSDVLEGIAMVDESLLTGESAPVRKAPGDVLIGGSRVVSDSMTTRITANPGESFVDQMITMVESSKRPKTPNERAVTMVLLGLTAIFTIIVGSLLGLSIVLNLGADLSVLIALYVCLLPTTIGALLPAIGLSGISRLYAHRIVAKSGKSIETAGDADVILLDKTGTITVGNRRAVEFVPLRGHTEREVGEAAFLSSWHDDTPEGRSIINLAYDKGFVPRELNSLALSDVQEFSASTRISGVKITRGVGFVPQKADKSGEGRMRFSRKYGARSEEANGSGELDISKGAPDSAKELVAVVPDDFDSVVTSIASAGETPMALVRNGEAIGIIRLKDVLKEGIREKILAVKTLGIRPVMITGDQPLTAKSIAAEVGLDEFVPLARPEDKFEIVKKEQAQSRIVAMIGDGTNDAPALAVADVGLAMNSGTEAAKEAANMVDLESNPAKVIDVVMLGKQLLMTRGAVTAFSIANDVAKYFAIIPVLFAASIPQLQSMNILGLSLHTAVLSALIFNAVIIPLLIPIAMRGIAFRPADTMTIFLRNIVVYGIGGVVIPFMGIKAIDLLISAL
ncbi:MAG TPA: potassium-transporting ATPase subunit KdpB [Nitrososphaerales archaeon]|nr:potassium-transporting ATPase subunit KdpB [Nitrososphaerales archaeon]